MNERLTVLPTVHPINPFPVHRHPLFLRGCGGPSPRLQGRAVRSSCSDLQLLAWTRGGPRHAAWFARLPIRRRRWRHRQFVCSEDHKRKYTDYDLCEEVISMVQCKTVVCPIADAMKIPQSYNKLSICDVWRRYFLFPIAVLCGTFSCVMMMSWHTNAFRITDHLCGESTGHR